MNKKSTLKIIFVILGLIIILVLFLFFYKMNNKDERDNIEETENNISNIINDLEYEYNDIVYIKDIINEESDELLNTNTLGNNKYIYKNYEINYIVKDTTKPLIKGSSTITVVKGTSTNLVNKMLCGDNYDSKPNCTIEGEYDLNKVGKYKLTYVATDSSNNKNSKNFTLNVINKKSESSSTSKKQISINDYIKKYKNDETLIGIDVSAWQSNINYSKVKKYVDFAIIRIGYGPSDGKLKKDSQFDKHLKGFTNANIPTGVYFYSYAKNEKDIIEEANWIVKQLNGKKLEMPIALDWENWSSYNKYHLSFKELTDLYIKFKEILNKNGYETMLYSSAYYVNNIWNYKYIDNTWVAYYTTNNDFSKPYMMWQATSRGKVDGISGNVDIDIYYKNKNSDL